MTLMAKERVLSVTLADCEVQHFSAGGKGGQNQNRRSTGTRIIHHPSGARGESREERSQLQNKTTAFKRMAQTKEFRLWLDKQMGRVTLAEIQVSEAMRPRNIKTEVLVNGVWTVKDIPTPDWWKQ
jgi:protein subunit release factor A